METMYKIYHDSSHFVGTKYIKKSYCEDKLSIKSYESEYLKNHKKIRIKDRRKKEMDKSDPFDELINTAYVEALQYGKKHRLEVMQNYLKEHNLTISDETIKKYIDNKNKNLKVRVDRFRKKALINKWNYFVTITYDDKKHDEETFLKTLKKCLANLHDNLRGGYRYMGVFERGAEGRLHFHALFYIPKGQMKGKIEEKLIYSYKTKSMKIVHENTWFLERFGTNDFIKIDTQKLMRDNTINYLLKYIAKSDEPIFYSRDISTFLYVNASENDVITAFGDFVIKYVFFDDVVESNEILQMRC